MTFCLVCCKPSLLFPLLLFLDVLHCFLFLYLPDLNSVMRRIDLTCKIGAPIIVSLVLTWSTVGGKLPKMSFLFVLKRCFSCHLVPRIG